MRLTGVVFEDDSPKFDTDQMLTLFKVRERVAVLTHAHYGACAHSRARRSRKNRG
jgi:hypothetical protein